MPAIPMSMDLSLEAEAFGAEVIITDDEVPAIKGPVVTEYTEIVGLPVPEPSTQRINAFVEAAELLVGQDFGKPVFAGCIGPYSLAGRLLDLTEILTGIFIYPVEVHQFVGEDYPIPGLIPRKVESHR
jgi:uroporphyrinogen decarboxylase